MKLVAVAVLALVAVGLSGCGLDPFEPETQPPVADLEVRITEGIDTTRSFAETTEIAPPSTIQVRSLIGDGDAIEFDIPRGPANELELVATEADAEDPLASISISAADGDPIEAARLHSFDPGFVAIEDDSDADRLLLRATAPRLLNTGQGQVDFSFKIDFPPAPATQAGPE